MSFEILAWIFDSGNPAGLHLGAAGVCQGARCLGGYDLSLCQPYVPGFPGRLEWRRVILRMANAVAVAGGVAVPVKYCYLWSSTESSSSRAYSVDMEKGLVSDTDKKSNPYVRSFATL